MKKRPIHLIGISDEDYILGAFDKAKLIGLIMAERQDDNIFHLSNLYVAPQYRRQGIGTVLFEKILQIVDNDPSSQSTTLEVSKTKPHLQSTYQRFGFVPIPQGILSQIFLRNRSMERRLCDISYLYTADL